MKINLDKIVPAEKAVYVEIILGDGTMKHTELATVTPKDIDSFYTKNDGIDLITTLESYLDHTWLAKCELEIVNDYTIYTTPLAKLTDGSWLYSYMKRKYNL